MFAQERRSQIEENGADEGTRTPDPRITNALLYQLSYIGIGEVHTAPTYDDQAKIVV